MSSNRGSGSGRAKRVLLTVLIGLAGLGTMDLVRMLWSHDLLKQLRVSAALIVTAGIILLLVGLVTGMALRLSVLLRRAMAQQRELLASQFEGLALKTAYQQLLDNLPIGLFTYKEGAFYYTNWAWDAQLLRHIAETPSDAFGRAIHPDDRLRVLKELDRCCRCEEPLQVNLRLVHEFQEERTVEMRAAPVYESNGDFRHMLGFSIDVSDAARANRDLQKYNLEVETKNQMLTTALSDIEANFTAMVESLVKAVEAKDPYTAGHSERVMQYSIMVGEYFGLNAAELKTLKMGTLIHDIGKIGVPDEILTKPSGLTKEEFDIVKRHPEIGYEMIQGIPMLRECAPIVRLHHERLDGSGYPLGLSGDDIPLIVRIAAIADIFDAMTSNRAYRRGLSTRVAIDELRREASLARVDKDIVESFARAISRDRKSSSLDQRAA